LKAEVEQLTAEVDRLQAELTECEAARDDFFDDADRYMKRIREIEKQALTPERTKYSEAATRGNLVQRY
jgi:predicted nuclease with TOPRIM domain